MSVCVAFSGEASSPVWNQQSGFLHHHQVSGRKSYCEILTTSLSSAAIEGFKVHGSAHIWL